MMHDIHYFGILSRGRQVSKSIYADSATSTRRSSRSRFLQSFPPSGQKKKSNFKQRLNTAEYLPWEKFSNVFNKKTHKALDGQTYKYFKLKLIHAIIAITVASEYYL